MSFLIIKFNLIILYFSLQSIRPDIHVMKRPNVQSSDQDSPKKRNRENEETIRLLIPSKVRFE